MMNKMILSERISDGKVQAKAILEPWYVIITFLSCFVWCMQSHTHINTYDQKLHIVT